MIIAGVRFIDMGLKAWVFTEADNYTYEYVRQPVMMDEKGVEIEQITEAEAQVQNDKRITQQRQRDAASASAQLIIGLPLYLYHWRIASKKREEA